MKDKDLLDVLASHGFETAAELFQPSIHRINIPRAIQSWAHYPECMAIYPKTLTNTKVRYTPR